MCCIWREANILEPLEVCEHLTNRKHIGSTETLQGKVVYHVSGRVAGHQSKLCCFMELWVTVVILYYYILSTYSLPLATQHLLRIYLGLDDSSSFKLLRSQSRHKLRFCEALSGALLFGNAFEAQAHSSIAVATSLVDT